MKISLAWVFDHIDAAYTTIDVPHLVTRFNETTAEIEGYHAIKTDLNSLLVAQVKSVGSQIILRVPEQKKNISLPFRMDARVGDWFMITQHDESFTWTRTVDVGGKKDMPLPPLAVSVDEQAGGFRKNIEAADYILVIDNKSITHRPDLWGHRGFAREIAALLNLSFKPLDKFLIDRAIQSYDEHASCGKNMPYALSIANKACHRFAALYLPEITMGPSSIKMAVRLSRVDSRSLDAVIDCTNYVMLDLGQPMHAFDATALQGDTLTVRSASNKETITLLDEQTLELSDHDLVVADAQGPVALAGIMGGKRSAVRRETSTLLLESANFAAATVRRTAQRYKLRTEASMRFEKSLDPDQNTYAILRFLRLLDEQKIAYKASPEIISLGVPAAEVDITVAHSFIEARLGTSLAPEFIKSTLTKLEFEVEERYESDARFYRVRVPSFRATKDIRMPIDIVEEVGRFYGYGSIAPELPRVATAVRDNYWVHQLYTIKQFLAFGLAMHELYTYALFDESFVRSIAWDPEKTALIADPISENMYRLVTCLLPNIFKAVQENSANHDELRFFEWGRCWNKEGDRIIETKALAGIFFDKRKPIDFYDAKALLEQFLAMLSLPVRWQHDTPASCPWFSASQTALLIHNDIVIGRVGKVDPLFFKKVCEGDAFIFELNGDFLEQYRPPVHQCVPVPKYPAVERDISMLVPLAVTVEDLSRLMQNVDSLIVGVTVIDMFQKKEWKDQRAITMRYMVQDLLKTMTKEQVDMIHTAVVQAVEAVGVTVR